MDIDAPVTAALLEVLDAVGVGVFTGDGHQLLEVNEAMTTLFGRERAELVGTDPTAYLAPSDRVIMAERARDVSGSVLARRVAIVQPDGDRREANVASMVVSEGLRVGLVIDESTLAETTAELEMFHTLADNIPAGALVWAADDAADGVDMRLHWANTTGLDLLGVHRDDALGQRLGDLFPFMPPALADRALALAGTSRAERLDEGRLPAGGEDSRIMDRMLIGLADRRVAFRVVDVTDDRREEERQLALLRRVAEIGDLERQQLAMNLHDDAIQQAAAAAVLLEGLTRRPDAPDRADRLATAADATRHLVGVLRRLVFELSPPELAESGIKPALTNAAAALFAGTDTDVDLDIDLPSDTETSFAAHTTTYRIAVEALTNARKHARAATVELQLKMVDNTLELTVRDDGVGLRQADTEAVPGHLGLRSMTERAAGAGGTCSITTRREGGVQVHATIPTAATPPTFPTIDLTVPEPGEVLALREALRDATAAITHHQRRADRARRHLDDLARIGRSLMDPTLSVARVAELATRQLAQTTGQHVLIHLTNPSGPPQLTAASTSDDDVLDRARRHVIEAGHLDTALRSSAVVHVDNAAEQEDGIDAVIVPLAGAGATLGAITFMRDPTSGEHLAATARDAAVPQIALALALARSRQDAAP